MSNTISLAKSASSFASARVLPDLTEPANALEGLSKAQLVAMIEALKAAPATRAISFKVTERKLNPKTGEMSGKDGAISCYGLGQFPTTLYASQWERLLDSADALRAFITANNPRLARKS